ncbi:hypothetical protein IQ252_05850 [Tychonema sp. LEGE 07203]|nr:hypothetical protein [Tychonema sp. LEGE 07203]
MVFLIVDERRLKSDSQNQWMRFDCSDFSQPSTTQDLLAFPHPKPIDRVRSHIIPNPS